MIIVHQHDLASRPNRLEHLADDPGRPLNMFQQKAGVRQIKCRNPYILER